MTAITYTDNEQQRDRKRMIFAIAFVAGILGLTAAGVYAGLNATASGSEDITSGTLSLTVAPGTGSAGFAQTVSSNMLPGDSVSTFVDLSSSGGADAKDLTLAVAGSPSNNLTTSATKGLAVTVTACSVAWTVDTSGQTATCTGGTTTTMLASTPVANLTGGPAGSLASSFPNNTTQHLEVTTTLPDSSETTTDGNPPTGTIQGLSATVTFTFSDAQRDATSSVA